MPLISLYIAIYDIYASANNFYSKNELSGRDSPINIVSDP